MKKICSQPKFRQRDKLDTPLHYILLDCKHHISPLECTKRLFLTFLHPIQNCNSMSLPFPPLQPTPTIGDNPPGAQPTVRVKCGARGCVGSSDDLAPCYFTECGKNVHLTCYDRLILKKYKVDDLIDPANMEKLFVCSKTCYNKVEKAIVNQPSRIPWDKDGHNGPSDPINSMKVLLDWLLVEGNYMRF
eukprot:scaffold5140_cov212-Amphora_coffeaeformis.AAC.3